MHISGVKTLGAHGFSKSLVMERLRSIGLSEQDAFWLNAKIVCWLKSNGIDWTIARLKLMRQVVLHFWAQDDVTFPWVAIKQGFPLAYRCLRKYSVSKIQRVLVIYKMFQFTSPRAAQVEKFVSAVRRAPVNESALLRAKQFIEDGFIGDRSLERKSWKIDALSVIEYPIKVSWAKLGVPGLMSMRHSMSNKDRDVSETWIGPPAIEDRALILEDAMRVMKQERFSDFLYPYRADLIRPLIPSAVYQPFAEVSSRFHKMPKQWVGKVPDYDSVRNIDHAGGIAATQEPGGKLRVFASPFPVLQCALVPFETVLDSLMRLLPTDFRFNQEEGAKEVQRFLLAHPDREVHSIDLSNATDAFPLELQTHWMRTCTEIRPNLIGLFETVSKGTFFVDPNLVKHGFPATLSWTVGQPLGTRGSFQSFSLTHSYLVRGIEKALHGRIRNEFVVLGDDIVIFDNSVKEEYLAILSHLGVNVAMDKTLSSKTAAEFAGFFITRKSMVRAGRQKATTSSNVRSQAQAYGPTIKSEIVRTMSDLGLVEAFAKLPKSVGGFGWETSQALSVGLSDTTVGALCYALSEVRPELKSLNTDWPLKRVYVQVATTLGAWYSSLDLTKFERVLKSRTSLQPEILDSIAYNWCNYKLQHVAREAVANFDEETARKAFLERTTTTLERVKASIESRYWQRPGLSLDQSEKLVLEIAYRTAIESVGRYEKSSPAPIINQWLLQNHPELKQDVLAEQETVTEVIPPKVTTHSIERRREPRPWRDASVPDYNKS